MLSEPKEGEKGPIGDSGLVWAVGVQAVKWKWGRASVMTDDGLHPAGIDRMSRYNEANESQVSYEERKLQI